MPLEYTIAYHAQNTYQNDVSEAFWQFCILPEENGTQKLVEYNFNNSLQIPYEISVNGFGFEVIRVNPKTPFKEITFDARFTLQKVEVNPFDFTLNNELARDYDTINSLEFQVNHEPFLRETKHTRLPLGSCSLFTFDAARSIFHNLQDLNQWVYHNINYKTGVTNVDTDLKEILNKKHGVCQDFAHLFCAFARENGVPVRYVSGYLHQGIGFFGDSQMHAWVEAFVPNVGWVGFDPTNNILVNHNHIKVAHGKDYKDSPPIKGVVYTHGNHETKHQVQVITQQQQ